LPIVSITKASKLSGKSIRTLHRHLASGRLSYVITDSGKGVDTSELIRAYGTIMAEMSDDDKNQMAGHDTDKKQTKDKTIVSNEKQLEHKIELLKLELEAEKRLSNERLQTIDAKQETIDTLKVSLKLLEHKQARHSIKDNTSTSDNKSTKTINKKTIEPFKNQGLIERFKKFFK